MNNNNVYKTSEFDLWAFREGLIDAEKFLINKYLNKDKITIEAGTAGGRILFDMSDMGFTNLHGYDLVPEFIEQAKERDVGNAIHFSVENAIDLSYPDNSFDQLIYLQQILSAVGSFYNAEKSVAEAYRILKKEGVSLFSFCNYEERKKHPLYFIIILYIKVLRKFKTSRYSTQYLPWFKQGRKPNFKLFLDKEPYNYWFKPREAYKLLKNAGFQVIGIASQVQINQCKVISNIDEFESEKNDGMVYFICRK